MPDWTLTDYDDKPITVGTRVRYYDYDPEHPDWGSKDAHYIGTVTDLGEFDGDYDDELERGVFINPRVTVRFDDGTEQQYATSEWEMNVDRYLYEAIPVSGMVEELKVIE